MGTFIGLDAMAKNDFASIRSKSIGLVCNQATCDREYRHILDLLAPLHREGKLRLEIVFGPQHGLFGHTQDNMIEWEGSSDNRWEIPISSLYGENRSPKRDQLKGLDALIIDLPDIGSRYYTFLWTTALCMEECAKAGVPVVVLDRPNPIGGFAVEGPVLDPEFSSFVGLFPAPIRHGMTLGEFSRYLQARYFPNCELRVESVTGWSRSDFLEDVDSPWVMPSPNMPTTDTALVYPGGCLLEGTNLSEGRGTTRPFETFGAPYVDGWKLAEALNSIQLPGCFFRPTQFQPTFQKFAGRLCEGCFVHVLDKRVFEPVLSYIAILQEVRKQCGDGFGWNPPPYEYETQKLPIDILAGNDWLRPAIDEGLELAAIRERMMAECEAFKPHRDSALIYN